MLSIYSLVKLPEFGNCQVQISEEPRLLSLSDLTSAFQESAPLESRLEGLKQKLDGLVEEAECENVFSDISSSDNVTDCIIYYVVGFLCRKILKNTTCQQCRNGLAATSNAASKPEAALVACKTRGGLVHPNTCLFMFLSVYPHDGHIRANPSRGRSFRRPSGCEAHSDDGRSEQTDALEKKNMAALSEARAARFKSLSSS